MNGFKLPLKDDLLIKISPFQIVLLIFILYGVACKLLISLNFELNSDAIYPGMIAIEIWKHHNFFLNGYNLISMDTSLFDDFLPFHLIPQVLSNYDPNVLRLSAFGIFLLAVAIFSYIIYKYSGNFTWSLIFAALAVNMDPLSYSTFFAQPSYHIATILFAGIFILIFLGTDILNPDRKKIINFLPLAILIVLINLIAFSDGMILPFFLLPFTFIYVVFYKKKTKVSNLLLICIYASLFATYIFSMFIINLLGFAHFHSLATLPVGPDRIFIYNIPLYIQGLAFVYDSPLYLWIMGYVSLSIVQLVILICALVLLYFVARSILGENKRELNMFRVFLIIATAAISIPYVLSRLCVDIATSRYFTFTILSFYALISMSYYNKNKIFIASLIGLLLINCYANYQAVSVLGYKPNQNEYGMVQFLESKNLSFGYGSYWDAQIITYLSRENVTIRPAVITNGVISPFRFLTNNHWYDQQPDVYFYMVNNNDADQVNQSAQLVSKYAPVDTYTYEHYMIYTFNRSDMLVQFN